MIFLVGWPIWGVLTCILWLVFTENEGEWTGREVAAMMVLWPLVWLYCVVWMVVKVTHGAWLLARRGWRHL